MRDVKNIAFIEPDDKRWSDFLQNVEHDIYHLPEYVSLTARFEGGNPIAFWGEVESTKFLIPLILRKIPSYLDCQAQWSDVTSPYGYSAPLIMNETKGRNTTLFFSKFIDLCKEKGIISVFLRFHPFLSFQPDLLNNFGTVVKHGPTLGIELSLPREDLWKQTRENHRRDIGKLKKLGFTCKINDWKDFPEFISIYRETMKRQKADPFYFFPEEYFLNLKEKLNERLNLMTILSDRGEIAAAGLFLGNGKILQYHLGGTTEKYLSFAPSKLLFDSVRWWAKDQGFQFLYLGGGVGGQKDSLFSFKKGFSNLTGEFNSLRIIVDPDRYKLLNKTWEKRFGGDKEENNYFPSYRRTLHGNENL